MKPIKTMQKTKHYLIALLFYAIIVLPFWLPKEIIYTDVENKTYNQYIYVWMYVSTLLLLIFSLEGIYLSICKKVYKWK
jgi:hypothetical protein